MTAKSTLDIASTLLFQAAGLVAFLAALPVLVPLFCFRWFYVLVMSCSGRLEYAIKLAGLTLEEIVFFLRRIPTGVELFWKRAFVRSEVYTEVKGHKVWVDVYPAPRPAERREGAKCPVVVFIYGGAWSSGSRSMYITAAERIQQELNVNVLVPDYLYYPMTSMPEMAAQLEAVQDFAVATFGDGVELTWLGHSAGAHLVALWSIRRHLASVGGDGERLRSVLPDSELKPPLTLNPFAPYKEPTSPASPHDVSFHPVARGRTRSVVLASGVYDVRKHLEWETARGVHQLSPMKNAVFGHFEANSPTHVLQDALDTHGAEKVRSFFGSFPEVHVVHGARDLVVPDGQSHELHHLFRQCGVSSQLHHRFPLDHPDVICHLFDRSTPSPLLPVLRETFSSLG